MDDHHTFPKAYLGPEASAVSVGCVLNRTLIDKLTNIRISAKAPSKYLGEMRQEMSDELLRGILASHGLPSDADGPLFRDQFDVFLDWRQAQLTAELQTVTGWSLS